MPILNHPLLAYLIRQIKQAGIDHIAINLHYQGACIREWLGSGERLGVHVTYSEEDQLLGSAGGVRRLRQFFGDQPALIIHGDVLFDVDLSKVIQYHQGCATQATLVLHPAHQRYNYGNITVNAQGQIGQFVDRHAASVDGPLIETIFTGIQILEPTLLDALPEAPATFLTTDVYPQLLTNTDQLRGYVMSGYWSDIGTPRRYWETNLDVVSGRIGSDRFATPDAHHPPLLSQSAAPETGTIQPPVAMAPGVSVKHGARIGPEVIVGEGCEIAQGARLTHTVLWPRVSVGRGVSITRCVIVSDVNIPDGVELIDKIVSLEGVVEL